MDITMCRSRLCNLSETCLRHPNSGSKPDRLRQSWFVIDNEADHKNGCEYYWHTQQQSFIEDDGDDVESIKPNEPGDGRIIRKEIDDE